MYKVGDWVRNNQEVEIYFGGDARQTVTPDTLGVVEYIVDPGEGNDIGVRWIDAGGSGKDFVIEVRNEDVRKQQLGFDSN